MIQVQLKLRPTKAQARTFERWLWHMTGVWNWSVRKLQADAEAGINYSKFDLRRLLNGHQARLQMPSALLAGTAYTARGAWTRYRKGIAGRPKLKGVRRPLSSLAFSEWTANPKNGRIRIPVMGPVPIATK